ncbi:ABC transporter substrate-binding protein [Pseudoglutamicibacter cumminsii]|uniref:ABC transporter substrate-binding protein n=1 Tax=Pseudoglutamicibacter cumminsii TaxID=156979 RepID=UPI0025564200|nr:ABC transporter substrate-binding protein [Pseudoglutamicibacter cumminsii]MDZ3745534.1 ABC transporter substrate-binding protein [Pseudoglutamicibacter cumminsii]
MMQSNTHSHRDRGRISRETLDNAGPSRRTVLGWGLMTLMAAGCARVPSAPDKQSRTELSLLASAPPTVWDPAFILDVSAQQILQQVCPPLLSIDSSTGNLTGILASSASLNKAGTRLRVTLAKGLTFSDGTALDANALKANFERWQNIATTPSKPSAIDTLLADSASHPLIQRYETPTHNVLDVHFTRACFSFPEALTHPGLGVLSPASFRANETDPVTETIGAGAYRIESKATTTAAQREAKNTTTLKLRPKFIDERVTNSSESASPSSSDADASTTEASTSSSLRAAPEKDQAPRTVSFIHTSAKISPAEWLASDHDSATHTDIVDAIAIKEHKEIAQAGLRVLHRDPHSVIYLGFNHDDEQLSHPAMRQAIVHNIDERELLKDHYPESTLSANGFTPASLGVQPERPFIREEKPTEELLEAAGYTGQSIPLAYPTGVRLPYLPRPEATAQNIHEQLSEANITTHLKPMRWDTEFLPALLKGEHTGLWIFGLHGLYRSPHDMLARLFSGAHPLCNARLTDIPQRLDAALTIASPTERRETYKRIQKDLLTDLPLYPLILPVSTIALSRDVTSYPLSSYLEEPLEYVTLK